MITKVHIVIRQNEFINGAQISNGFIVLMALSESKQSLSTTQISEIISTKSKGKLFKVSGALKDSLERCLFIYFTVNTGQ